MQHIASHTTAVQSPSHCQWYVLIGKQRYQLPEFLPSNSNSGLHSCISNSQSCLTMGVVVHRRPGWEWLI